MRRFATIRLVTDGPVAQITLDRPEKLNAITAEMVEELHVAMDLAEADRDVRVIVLRGGGRAFCAGFDLAGLDDGASVDETRAVLAADLAVIMRFWRSPKPTVSVVHGYALGGGFELAMACDITLATTDAVFGEPEPTFGSGIVALLLPWVTGPKAAKELLLFGADRITADRAAALGLVNAVVAGSALDDEVARVTRRCALLDATAVQLTKRAVNRSYELMGLETALEAALEIDVEIETTVTDESRAFLAIMRRDGVQAALAWRERRLDGVSARSAAPAAAGAPAR